MGLREGWGELDTGVKILVGLGVGLALLVIAIPVLIVLSVVLASFVLGLGDAESAAPEEPQVSMRFDYDADTEAMTIVHEGGDSIDAEQLGVRVDDRRFQWDDSDGTVTAGDRVTVPAQPGADIRVVWEGESTVTLDEYDVPA